MKSFNNGVSRGLILAGTATLLAACGGGGGGDTPFPGGGEGSQANPYVIKLRADRTQLPLNLEGQYPGTGLEAIYTTTLYVTAHRERTNDPIPPSGEDEVFGCNVIPAGLEYGALAYNDGKDEHMIEVTDEKGNKIKVPALFRSVGLPANAGGASFHFHAGSQIGTATVTCSVTDPLSHRQVSTSIQINVGGASSGKAAMVTIEKAHTSGDRATVFIHNQNAREVVLIGTVRDESMQPVADSVPMCARIVPFPNSDAFEGTELFSGGGRAMPGTWIQSPTIRGEARFTLRAGTRTGPIGVEIRANRDGNANDCAGFDINNLAVVTAIDNLWGAGELKVNTDLASYYLGQGYLIKPVQTPATFDTQGMTVLDTAGTGQPPFIWRIPRDKNGNRDPLQDIGLTLTDDGAIVGVPTVAGETQFTVRVEDGLLSPRRRQDQVVTFGVYAMPSVSGTYSWECEHGDNLALDETINASGGKIPLTISVEGTPPAGISIIPVTGGARLVTSAVCSNPGECDSATGKWKNEDKIEVSPISVTVTDANGVSVTDIVSITLTTKGEKDPGTCKSPTP